MALAVTINNEIRPTGGLSNGSLTAVVTGGVGPFAYMWSDGQTTPTATGLATGTYTVLITDAVLNSVTSAPHFLPPAMVITVTSSVQPTSSTSADGSINTNTVGGISPPIFTWTGPGGYASSLQNITNLLAGVYSLTVTDSVGVSTSLSVTLYAPVIEPPISNAAGDGTGAKLSLSAIGKQDTFLNGKDGSFWKQNNVQHTNFSRFQKAHKYTNNTQTGSNWPFGDLITFQINPKTSGDIMSNMYLKITMPGFGVGSGSTYCDQIGRAIINKVSFNIGGTTIETLEDDWYIINDELYATQSQQTAYRDILNGGQAPGGLNGSTICEKDIPLYIPLGFFFCRAHETLPGSWDNNVSTDSGQGGYGGDALFRPYMYTCACLDDMISVDVTFNPVTFFSNVASLSLPSVTLVTEGMVLTDMERSYLMSNRQQYIIPTVQKQPVYRLDKDAGVTSPINGISTGSVPFFHNQLVGLPPIKAFHWFMRNQAYEESSNVFHFEQRYNFSSNGGANVYQENLFQIMSDAWLYINGKDLLGFIGTSDRTRPTGANYYKHVQPYQHGLTTPLRNIYTYSFALLPKNPQPTGSVDFSSLTSSKTTLNGSIMDTPYTEFSKYNMHLYYTGFKFLVYENNRCGLLFA